MWALNLEKGEGIVILWASWDIANDFMQYPIIKDKIAALVTSSEINLWNDSLNLLSQIKDEEKDDRKRKRKDIILKNWREYDDLLSELENIKSSWIKPIIVDLSNGDLTEEHKYLIENWHKVIWANKIPLSTGSFDDFNSLVWTNYWAEATVMGWQWIYWAVENNSNAWIEIQQIDWVFSGTMWYIMSELENWKKFSDIIRKAMKEWYTETNPMDDLDWLDVAKKLVILARRAGHDISIQDVEVQWLLDDSYREFFKDWITEESKEAFLEKIKKEEDPKYEEKAKEAKEDKKTLRYLAQFIDADWELKAGVNMQIVLKNSQLGWLSWTDNIAVMKTPIQTSTIIWPWAGIEVTSSNVLKNLFQILNNR